MDGVTELAAQPYEPGEDDLWDRLGSEDWRAVDGIHPDATIYVRWREVEGERPQVTGLCVVGEKVTADVLRSIPVSRLEAIAPTLVAQMAEGSALSGLEPLARREGEHPDDFSKRVAQHYRRFAAASSKPTKDLAGHAGVPLPTMRSWIREARLRGYLPPGTRGKAG
jgi:hypothetical protein